MLDLRWAPLVGATVMTKRAWDRIPSGARPAVLRAAAEAGERLKGDIRAANDKAIAAMKEHGLKIEMSTPSIEAAWQKVTASDCRNSFAACGIPIPATPT